MSEALPDMFRDVDDFIESHYTRPDDALKSALRDSEAAGLPRISVSANEGKLLQMLALISGAKRILEIGLLGGYSTIWLARALPPGGKVVSLEVSELHAQVARKNLERAGVLERIEIRMGPALDTLQAMSAAREAAFDFVFIDADKNNYPKYLDAVLALVRPGSVIVGDNVIQGGKILGEAGADADLRGLQEFNLKMAHDPRLESIAIPLIRRKLDGIAVARVK